MKTVITLHGFFERSGKDTTDKLTPYLKGAGLNVVEFDYGFKVFVSFRNEAWAKEVADIAGKQPFPVCLVAFSNGADIAVRAAWRCAGVRRLVLIRPAVKPDVAIPPHVDRVFNFLSPYDPALAVAPLVQRLNPWSRWGTAGRVGLKDPRAINIDTSSDKVEPSKGHLDIWDDDRLGYWGRQIAVCCLD